MHSDTQNLTWPEFQALTLENKKADFTKNGKLFHCLHSQQFDRDFLDHIYKLTNVIRSISKSKKGAMFLQGLMPHYKAMLYFMQPSTRTYLSFRTACQILGIQTSDVRDASISSEAKGETFEDTIRTFSSYFNFIIMRHPEDGYAERAAFCLNNSERPIPILNAGSGKDQHPTQAILDIYTLRRSFENHGGLEGKTLLLAGDLLRGRTVRSLSKLIAFFPGTKLILSSPEKFKMANDIIAFLDKNGVDYLVTHEFEKHLPDADAIYMTRVQDEHDTAGNKSERSFPEFSLLAKHLPKLKDHCAIMHPLPRRDELDSAIDNDPRAKYWRQERNGMWARAALMCHITGYDQKVMSYWSDICKQANHTAEI